MSGEAEPVIRRLRGGVVAQGFWQVTILVTRLTEVPLFLTFWGAERYGQWLMIAAIPVYLAMADGGFTGATQREMTMCMGAGDRNGALAAFQSTWILLFFLSVALLGAAALIGWVLPVGHWLNLPSAIGKTLPVVIVLLTGHVVLSFQCGLLYGGYSCVGRYPRGTVLAALMYLFDFAGLAIAVIFDGGFLAVSAGYLIGRVIGLTLFLLDVRRVAPWLHYGWAHASRARMIGLLRPALASMMVPLADALNHQGMRLVVGMALGPIAVSLFTSVRTLSRTAIQPILIVARLVEPEIALAFGAGRLDLLNKIFLRSSQVTFWSAILVCAILGLCGELLFDYWTRGRFGLDMPLFGLLLLAAMANSVWFTAFMVPYASNRHERIACFFVITYGAMIAAAWRFMSYFGISGAGAAVLFAESAMIAIVLPTALRMTGIKLSRWTSTVLRPPLSVFRRTQDPVSRIS